MRTEKEIRVEIQSLTNGMAALRGAISERRGDLRTLIFRLRRMKESRDLLRWVLGER